MQSKLKHNFTGKNMLEVNGYFSTLPSSRIPLENGNSKIIFTKKEKLSGTTINQGTTTLDPINSPAVIKTEQYIFIVDENDIVISTKYESDYERR